ncbi:protein of unknown function (plasmid) [Cupriavidus taiwanensis]|uniref:Uncharacterized protein n=1 Tax=Cupriavidus taiwanensis TaxID=164546 RepID=A0A9Q7XWC6_9BURK|nr:protein of unknown function [Cupriavidus taiwanensis]
MYAARAAKGSVRPGGSRATYRRTFGARDRRGAALAIADAQIVADPRQAEQNQVRGKTPYQIGALQQG